jgi:WD40 repeat protein
LKGHSDTIHSIAATADGRFALSGGEEFSLRLWDVQSGRVLQELDGHTDGVTSVVFSGDGRYALSGSFDKTLKVWEFDWEWLYD